VLDNTVNVFGDAERRRENYHWQYTFDKLQLWGLVDYEKMVYLDSDMMVMKNIDDLFDRPNFSAVAAGRLIHPTWNRLNSGTMVVEPSLQVKDELVKSIAPTVGERGRVGQSTGDQDVINHYLPDWPDKSALHLPESYNLLFKHLTIYVRKHGFSYRGSGENAIKVAHFIGARKPWHLKGMSRYLYVLKLLLNNPCGVKAWCKYMGYIRKAENALRV